MQPLLVAEQMARVGGVLGWRDREDRQEIPRKSLEVDVRTGGLIRQ